MRPIRLTPRFLSRRAVSGFKTGSPVAQALGATIAALSEAATLPGLGDVEAMIPPTASAFVRRVPGHNLWVWYRVPSSGELLVLNLTKTPPVPIS